MKCNKEKSNRYLDKKRKAPPFKAKNCPNMILEGNDEQLWKSVFNGKYYKWLKVNPKKTEEKTYSKSLKKSNLKCNGLKKTKDPKCDSTDGCEWIVGKGCQKEESKKSKSKSKSVKKSNLKCKGLKKTKDPKCDSTDGCEWIVGKGCQKEERKKSMSLSKPITSENNHCKGLKKTKEPKCDETKGCEWIVGKGCQKEEEKMIKKPITSTSALKPINSPKISSSSSTPIDSLHKTIKIDAQKTVNIKKFYIILL